MNGGMTRRRNGLSGINSVLGIWLIISPFILGFAGNSVAEWNDIASGVAVALLALGGASWVNVFMGIWLIISPFVLGFAGEPTLLWNNVILGALVGTVAALVGSLRGSDAGLGGPPPPA